MERNYVIAVVMALVGVVFLGQGLGYIGGSGMTGSSFWAVVGGLLVIAAAALAWRTRRVADR
jgi:hypothetical protein